MALVRRDFEKKVEKFGIVECRWYGVLHVQGGIGRQTSVASNGYCVALGVATVGMRARSTGTDTRGKRVVVGKYGSISEAAK